MLFSQETYPPLQTMMETALAKSSEIILEQVQAGLLPPNMRQMQLTPDLRKKLAEGMAEYYEREDRWRKDQRCVSDLFIFFLCQMHKDNWRDQLDGASQVQSFVRDYLQDKLRDIKHPERATVIEVFTLAADIIKPADLSTAEKKFAKENGLNIKTDIRVRMAMRHWFRFQEWATKFAETQVKGNRVMTGIFYRYADALKGEDLFVRLKAASEAYEMFALYLELNPRPKRYQRRPSPAAASSALARNL